MVEHSPCHPKDDCSSPATIACIATESDKIKLTHWKLHELAPAVTYFGTTVSYAPKMLITLARSSNLLIAEVL